MQCVLVLFYLLLALVNGANIPIDGRIVGGHIVDIKKFPYQVSIHFRGRHICGGSIISPDTILTAAHCTDGSTASQLTVRSGSNSADHGTLYRVTKIEQHPQYNPQTISNDVSKLKITPPMIYSRECQPIKLAAKRPADNTLLVISGWGNRKENDRPSLAATRHLRAVIVPVVNQETCSRQYNKRITNAMICAAGRGKDSCQGDSGGPLVDTQTGEQVGISSWGFGCARQSFPGVYGSVADLLDFIQP